MWNAYHPVLAAGITALCLLAPAAALDGPDRDGFAGTGFSTPSISRHAVQKIYLGELEAEGRKSQAFVQKLDQALSAYGFVVVSLRQNADVLLTGTLTGTDAETPAPILKLERANGEELMHMEVPGEVDCSGRCQSRTAAGIAQNIRKHWKEGQVFPD